MCFDGNEETFDQISNGMDNEFLHAKTHAREQLRSLDLRLSRVERSQRGWQKSDRSADRERDGEPILIEERRTSVQDRTNLQRVLLGLTLNP